MRFVCDACQDITNIEADRMEIQGEKLMVYSRGRLVYVADLGQIRPYEPNVVKVAWAIFGDSYRYRAKYNEYKAMRREQEKARMQGTPQAELPGQITWEDVTPDAAAGRAGGRRQA